MNRFRFLRRRFHFRAAESVHFPLGKSGNVVRGAFGTALHETAPAEVYERLFEPTAGIGSPSGLTDLPRPFVFRTAHLDGVTVAAGGAYYLDVHLFLLEPAIGAYFQGAFKQWSVSGIGPRRGRVELQRVESLDAEGQAASDGPIELSLEPEEHRVERVRVRFVTPTELKSAGEVIERPDFAVLFARVRDRIATLSARYGDGPLAIDFRALGERAAAVRMIEHEIVRESAERRSGRTGQTHPIGGFTGMAEYAGDLAEFVPWLRAAQWTGVGRQTVWGKGEIRVE